VVGIALLTFVFAELLQAADTFRNNSDEGF
jgi:hypothetical protein